MFNQCGQMLEVTFQDLKQRKANLFSLFKYHEFCFRKWFVSSIFWWTTGTREFISLKFLCGTDIDKIGIYAVNN